MSGESMLRLIEGQIPNEISGEYVAAIGDTRPVISLDVALDRHDAAGAAVRLVGGEAVGPGVGKVDQRIPAKLFL